jgi:hypothetical protein
MAGLLEALNAVANRANEEAKAKKKPQTKLTPDYVKKNREDLARTFQTDESRNYNAKIRKMIGVE